MGRPRLKSEKKKEEGIYFISDKKDIEFIPSGSTLLDLVLSGGWPIGRVCNIVGDKSTGKTLLAIEGCVNFDNKYSEGKIFYHETEAAFDKSYAAALGMPIDKIDFVAEEYGKFKEGMNTIEGFFDEISSVIKKYKNKNVPCLYILDSLDALSDKAELKRNIDEGSYNLIKQKKLSELFRRLAGEIKDTEICLMIISQTRDKIGVVFGKKKTRSGGKGLDFYASQVLWLYEIKKLDREIKSKKIVYGLKVRAKCEKNKVGLPFRECEFTILFGYGVDSIYANLKFLEDTKSLDRLSCKFRKIKVFSDKIREENDVKAIKEIEILTKIVWNEIEISFLPKRKKY